MSNRKEEVYSRRRRGNERQAENQEVEEEINVVEDDEMPPNVTVNTDAFTQMMLAVTKLIQDSKSPASGSDPPVALDKYLKLFQDLHPPLFKGTEGPIEAENWLLRIEKILDSMACPEDRKVSLATFALDGEAERWWRGQRQDRLGNISNRLVDWEEFVGLFREWFVPMSARRQMQDKFIRLVQGEMTVMQYEAEFTALSRYAPQLISTAEEKCHRFLLGLKDAVRQPLVPLGIDDYDILVERARRVEIDYQATQKRRDFQKRSMEESEHITYSEGSNGKKLKSSISGVSNGTASRQGDPCTKCGRLHKGECLLGTNTCYRCHQYGHISRYCPTYGQKGSGEVKNDGRSNLPESTASASAQGQQRQKVRPRVYSLTQREQEEPTHTDGGGTGKTV